MEWSRREPIIHLQQLESFEPCCHQHVLRSLRDFWLAGPVTRMSCNSPRGLVFCIKVIATYLSEPGTLPLNFLSTQSLSIP